MNARLFSTLFLVFAQALFSTFAASRPNVLLIVGDDMGYADVGFHGCKDIPTPSLDALAKSSVRFTHGYVTGPYCSPTRAALLTGRCQQRFGHEFNPGGKNGLPLGERTLANYLNEVGYRTALIGKWHLGNQPDMHPQKRGFDEFFGFLGGAHDYFQDNGLFRGAEPVQEKEYLTDAIAREASAFIQRHAKQPWFLYLAFNAVHTPMQADDARLAKFASIENPKRRTYAAMMFAMDEAIGRVRKTLAEQGLEQNTIVFFISDNGGPTMPSTSVNAANNHPFRGSKRTTLEGGIRVPFLISWPGRVKPGVYDQPVIQMDLHSTALAAAAITPRKEWKIEGVNLLPYINSEKTGTPHEALYWRFGEQMAIRLGDYKLVRYDSNADTLTGAPNQPVTPAHLYNLSDDPGEKKNLASTQPDRVKELQAKWDQWNKSNLDPLWEKGEPGPGKAARKK